MTENKLSQSLAGNSHSVVEEWDDGIWDLVDRAVERFEQARCGNGPVELACFLPDAEDNIRQIVLVHLIRIDLELRWNRGERPRIEDYLRDWSNLQDDQQAMLDLLSTECRIRTDFKDPPTHDELRERFPKIAGLVELEELDDCARSIGHFGIDSVSLDDFVTSIGTEGMHRRSTRQLPTLSPGHTLGRYRIQSVLGRGGMGTVYLAADDELARVVAVKVLHPDWFSSEESENLLQQEARTVAKLNHPAIVPVYDVGRQEDGTWFFVMEYVAGESLADRIESGYIDEHQVEDICLQIAEALELAHAQGFVHRDVKPGNILINTENRVRITDFGLASHQSTDSHTEGELCGTLPYMSPEQFRVGADRLDGRADIWSLGVMLYELLTGHRPFEADSLAGWSEAIALQKPRSPRRIRRGISRELEWICMECLKKDPAQRYTTATEVAIDLRDAARPKSRRWRKILAITAVLLIILVPIDYFCYRFLSNPTLDYASSSNGGWLVSRASYYAGQVWYSYNNLPADVDKALKEIIATNGTIIGADFGSDDQWVVVYDRNGKRCVSSSNVPRALLDAMTRVEADGEDIQDVAFSPEGGWALLYQRKLRINWDYDEIPAGAEELLKQFAESDVCVGGIGLTENGGWMIFYKDRYDNCWRCRYENLSWNVVRNLKENRSKLGIRHAEGTTVPYATPAAPAVKAA